MGKRRRSVNGIVVPGPRGESESVRIRQIANGYLITRSGTKRGKYFEREEYAPSKPVITAAVPAKSGHKEPAQRPSTPRGHIRPGSL